MATAPPRRSVLAVNGCASSASTREHPSRPIAAESDHPPLVLVIEDNADLRELYCEVLVEEGFRGVPWSAPPAEPAYVATLGPELVVLDLLIDHADSGWQFLERLKADPVTAPIQVLVCAGDVAVLERVADRLPAWTCGALRKPFALEEFVAAVWGCLREAPRPHAD